MTTTKTLATIWAYPRIWVLLLSAALLGVWFVSRGPTPEVPLTSPQVQAQLPTTVGAQPLPLAPAVGGPQLSERRTQAGPEPSKAAAPDPAAAPDEAWARVLELRALARTPKTFHALALPVIEQLAQYCGKQPEWATGDSAGIPNEPVAPAQRLFERVVRSSQEVDLVRGAVLLASAPYLAPGTFSSAMSSWFAPESGAPGELLRAAAIAAAARGESSTCHVPLDLGYLAKLEAIPGADLPGIYPLKLERVIDPEQGQVLRDWLLLARIPKFPQQADFFVTCEVLFAVWGQRALLESAVEEVVMVEALRDATQRESGPLPYFRVANFLVHALSNCNDQFFELAGRLSSSTDPVLADIAASMHGLVGGGLGVALVSKIESLRYSTDELEQTELLLVLVDVGESLGSIADSEELSIASDYLADLALDPGVDLNSRASALTAIVSGASWSDVRRSARAIVAARGPDLLYAIALNSLIEAAAMDSTRREEALETLYKMKDAATLAWVRTDIDLHITQLSGG